MPYSFDTAGTYQPWDQREWLLTDGSGSFAMGTVAGVNTRRYHSLLNAALNPPVGRANLVPRVGEILLIDGQEALHELSNCIFARGTVHPRGYHHLKHFELAPHPGGGECVRWTYAVHGVTVAKTLHLPPMSASAVLTYDLSFDAGRWVELLLLPMVALRDFHALRRHERGAVNPLKVERYPTGLRVAADAMAVRIDARNAAFEDDPDWWYGHVYPIETERGQDDTEDLFKPGLFRARLSGSAAVTLTLAPDPAPPIRGDRIPPTTIPSSASPTLQRLLHATGHYLVRRKDPTGSVGTSILAGFPWFGDWGRDTFIALPGLLLSTGRTAEAGEVLSVFARYVDQGMIPNRFTDDTNQPEYNTVDASLWFVHAAFAYQAAAGDSGKALFAQKLLPACQAILAGYQRGTRYGIRMDADGLIAQGDAHTQLTWMDARHNGTAFTPRAGKPVEINALWHHALRLMGEHDLADRAAESFRRQFWISPQRGLADVVPTELHQGEIAGGRDTSCRPNQIFAVSLPHSPLTAEQQRAVVEVVRRELLTPFGLRTLSPSDRGYRPTYGGPQAQRDAAYHNGTVWPWLMGPFLEAYLRVHGDTREAREEARRMLRPLLGELETGCIGHLAEIYEAQPPHRAVGAPAQAWSLAEVVRLALMLGV